MMESDLSSFISSNNIFERTLKKEAVSMIYKWSVVREDGNDVAHEANKELVWDAIVHGDLEGLEILKNIYGGVYGEDIS
jgi:hypothetical protein